MSNVARFNPVAEHVGTGEYVGNVEEAADGDYVLWADYEAMERQRDDYREALRTVADENGAKICALEAELKRAPSAKETSNAG